MGGAVMGGLNDHIIRLGGSRFSVNAVAWAKDRLERNWDSGNTDAMEPRIVDSVEDAMQVDLSNHDAIIVYEVSAPTSAITITYGFTNQAITLTLDLLSRQSRDHFTKMVEEARRVMLDEREDTFEDPGGDLTGRTWLEWGIREQSFDDEQHGQIRKSVDVRINWRFRQIST